jgi:glucokinase
LEITAVDIGGTHARFARATLRPGVAPELSDIVTLKTDDHAGLADAWAAYRARVDGALPGAAAIAVAAPLGGDVVKFTNSRWVLHPASLAADLALDDLVILNDFGAVAHAVAWLDDQALVHVGGPDGPLPDSGVTSVIGLGTGLGVAMLLRRGGHVHALETEGGHTHFAPLDAVEENILAHLRTTTDGRVSTERVASGPGLANIYRALAGASGQQAIADSDGALWTRAIEGDDPLAAEALHRLVLNFGSISGDLALAHGANAVVLTGGLANRIVDRLRGPAFLDRFTAKGRYVARMQAIPIRLATHPQPGLLGAAAAFQRMR